jgi:hypothetical protein
LVGLGIIRIDNQAGSGKRQHHSLNLHVVLVGAEKHQRCGEKTPHVLRIIITEAQFADFV